MPSERTPSEEWFDEYLLTHGYDFAVEPPLGVTTRPDRLIDRAGVEAICEVKEFTTDALLRRWPDGGSRTGSFSSDEWLLPVRRTISEAARQLQPLADDERPLVIVLANPHGVAVDLDGPKLLEAMYGNLTITFEVSTTTGGAVTEPEWVLGGGGRLAEDEAPWVSAVVAIRHGDYQADWTEAWIEEWNLNNWPTATSYQEITERHIARTADLKSALEADDVPSGEYFFLHVIETASETATPLPRNIFDGERDLRWIVNRDEGTYDLLEPNTSAEA